MSMTFFYARVSTTDQTAAHQRIQAEKAGFTINEVVADEGVSGVSTKLADRPGGSRLLGKLREGDTLVVRWVDRLGRDYQDVTDTIQALMNRRIVVRTVINGLVFDGAAADPMQRAVRDALISFMAATAQAQAEASKEAQRAGIAHAKGRDDAYRGRKPSYSRAQLEAVRAQLAQGASVSAIARDTGLSRQTVYRIQEDPAEAEAALARWSA
ncbi:Site-specific DNA recombinase [Methylobacterium sp. 174MFSha1.1]|uniref:recombinase family protein n=1 Tax=Methylobacterium sp. 174MFSha1.1 TaxID=1502749 RepID=UPI0008F40DFF|nr:recombinase family protein [Methylobacterium sp. 174MFSha1.1]SFU53517.1 Site-specific DNA recombinase [Methylobacterium sp. 174MFSha1.1]